MKIFLDCVPATYFIMENVFKINKNYGGKRNMKKQNNLLTEGNMAKTLIYFVWPFLLAMLLQTLYGAADLIIVGQFSTTPEVSGVAVGSQVMTLITNLIVGFTSGITVLLGRYAGAKNNKKMRRVLGNSIILFFVLAIIIVLGMFIFDDKIIEIMHTPEEAVHAVKNYLFVCNIGVFFIMGYNIVRGIMMGLGDSRTPLICVLIACVLNIVVDIILVKFFNMGAFGAAVATSFSQGVSFIFSFIYLYKKGIGFKFRGRNIKISGTEAGDILKIGVPLALQNCLVIFSFLAITAITNRMGVVVSASVGIVEKLMEFLPMPSFALSTAISVIVAQNYGAGKYNRTKECLYIGMIITAIISVIAYTCCQFFSTDMTRLFSNDTEVIKSAAEYLRAYSLDCVAISFVFSFNGFFIGYTKAKFTMIHSVVTSFIIRIPLVYYFCLIAHKSLYTIGLASPASTTVSFIICLVYWKMFKIPEEKAKNVSVAV